MFYAVMLTCGIVGGLLMASRFGTEAAVQKVPYISVPDWLDIGPMQIDKPKEDIIQPEKANPQNNSAPAAAAGGADNDRVEAVEDTVEPPKPITEPGQGGT